MQFFQWIKGSSIKKNKKRSHLNNRKPIQHIQVTLNQIDITFSM